jgi:hypothetical protein
MSRIESLKRKILRESAAAVHSPESGEVARATEPVFGKTEPGANAVAVARAHPRTAERSIMVILRNMSQFLTKGLHRRGKRAPPPSGELQSTFEVVKIKR